MHMTTGMAAPHELSGIKVVDVDTHLTEPHDLWTSRAPERYRERVPRVVTVDGVESWTFDGVVLGRAGAGGVVRRDGSKSLGAEFIGWSFDAIHLGAHEVGPRLEVMDQLGIWAQIVYPNAVGFGGQKFAEAKDLELRALCARIFNDAMAEIQEASGDRLFPMAILPWWDLEAAVAEAVRIKGMGLRGVNTNADPQNEGLPDLGDRHWDPMWEACSDLGLPVNFHIGASIQQSTYFGSTPWPSQGDDEKLALGSAMMYLGNARVLGNLIYAGILERHPTLRFVSVESGIGWLPFILEALDYQIQETVPLAMDRLSMKPSEYFRRQVYACFWFESRSLVPVIEAVGVDNCMFETDFPHPTCLYPDPLSRVAESLAGVDSEFRHKVLSGNACRVYSLPVPAPVA
jgi:predicted TIM-barrel fold metal-dependent hydrolase